MNLIEIHDLNSPELAPYVRLTEAQLRQVGEGNGLFIAESAGVIDCALKAGHRPVSFLCEKKNLDALRRDFPFLDGEASAIPVYTAESALLRELTGFGLSRGMLAAMERIKLPSVEEAAEGKARIAVLEGISDSTNIGAIFRSAAALGMEAVLVCSNCCDPLNRRAARVSMGTVFQVPWAILPCLEESRNCADTSILKRLGFKLAAMALESRSVPPDDPALAGEERLAVLLGTEGTGLMKRTIEGCDYTVMIPMKNGVDSLNVAAASAVAFWALSAGVRERERNGKALSSLKDNTADE